MKRLPNDLEIVSGARLPSLNFGLKPALEDLADSLLERNKEMVKIVADILADGNGATLIRWKIICIVLCRRPVEMLSNMLMRK